jgi:hypothetical protein
MPSRNYSTDLSKTTHPLLRDRASLGEAERRTNIVLDDDDRLSLHNKLAINFE